MVKIVIGVCTLQWEKRAVDSFLDLVTQGEFAGWAIPDSALVAPARNKVIIGALEKCPDFTHLLFIDDDMTDYTVHHVGKLLQDDKDIISALVTARRKPYTMIAPFLKERTPTEIIQLVENNEVVETGFCGMAFTLIKRKVIDNLREDTDGLPVWFDQDRSPRDSFEDEIQDFIANRSEFTEKDLRTSILMGQNSHRGTTLIGEDVSFGRKARKAGFTCWVDCGVSVGHIGQNTYDYRYPLQMLAEEQKDNERKPDLSIVSPE